MDNNSKNKHKSRQPYFESSSSRDGTSGGNQRYERHWDRKRLHPKNRDQGRDGEWNRDRTFHGKSRRDEDYKMFREQQAHLQSVQQRLAFFPAYSYNAEANHPYIDNNRRAKMCYNGLATMAVNQFDSMPINSNPPTMPMSTEMKMVPADNMYGGVGMGNYCQYGMMSTAENMFPPVKEIVHLSKSILYPPNPNTPCPTTRRKPLGCKTVFVGGLPEKATEEIIKEIFDKCGSVETIRMTMSKKNFCHIRFANEICVENAIYFSGYRMKIENKEERAFTGKLHVDYAQARDDEYDYECKHRSLQRQARHQEQYYHKSVTPPVVHYNELEASLLVEKLRNKETFLKAASILSTWLEKGECSKRNAGTFYSMFQSINSHVRSLQVDKVKYEEQLNDAKKNLERIKRQLTSIVEVHKSVSLQKVWDHLTKAQRKHIEMWREQTEELRNTQVQKVINEREDVDMELSEDESGDASAEQKSHAEEIYKLREERDSLRIQIEALQNEIMVQSDRENDFKHRSNQKIETLQQALYDATIFRSQKLFKEESCSFKRRRGDEDGNDTDPTLDNDLGTAASNSSPPLDSDYRLISLMTIFLHAHPLGANIDYICSYLHQFDSTIKTQDVENFLKRFPMIFREDFTGIGVSLGKKWSFIAFEI